MEMTDKQAITIFNAIFKLKVIKNNSNRAAARRHQVDENSVRDWREQKEQLNTLPSNKS